MSFLKLFNEIDNEDIDLVGGKALSLGRLLQAGLPVPSGFVITTDAYNSMGKNGVSSELKEAIFKTFEALGADRVAVRSSAIAEDSPDASWAGQFDSYLNVGREQLIESVEKCWQSASSEVVEAYAEGKSTSKEQLAIAVVIQKMVNSEISGVAFSVNPISKSSDEIMIEAIYGLGELLVQGMVTPDNYVVYKNTFEVADSSIKNKPTMLVYSDGDNHEQPVPEKLRDVSCLNDVQLIEISNIIVEIENYFGTPQDIEWAFEQSSFYILQSRPITTL
jgi:phosphoenolpyruvate synthase/pyruvate phosphate dikinase